MSARPPSGPPGPPSPDPIAQAVGLHQAGRLGEAAELYARIIAANPQHFDALHLLGVIDLQQGRYAEAAQRIGHALQLVPDHAAALGNLGTVYLRMGRAEEARQRFARCVQLQPGAVVPLLNLASALRQLGRPAEALAPLREALAMDSRSAAVCNLLGACLLETGNAAGAMQMFEAVTILDPGGVDGWANLAAAIQRCRDSAVALRIGNDAVQRQAGSSAAHAVLAAALYESGQEEAALAAYRVAVSLPAPSAQTLCLFGNALLRHGRCAEARSVLSRAIDIDGGNAHARWALAIAWCEPIFADAAEIAPARAALRRELDGVRSWFHAARRPDAWTAVGTNQPFLLAYQPFDNRELLALHGSLCAEWMESSPAAATLQPQRARPAAGRRLRIGFVSAHVREHSVWTAITKGWVRHLDRARFETMIFQLNPAADRETALAREAAHRFVDQPAELSGWVDAILAAQPDVLVYPEIGMDRMTTQLAALRLAPVQAAAWGHPETSGLPTMDLYLSGAAFEPADGDRFYRERLVRLPGCGVHVEPIAPSPVELDLRQLGLPRDEPLLLCPGAPFKYSPLQDVVWARIARGLGSGGGRLVFFRSSSALLDELLEARLRRAFAREGVAFDGNVSIIPLQGRPQFFALLRQSALMLDTIGFSGFNTALQAVECGLPILAHEGRWLRARLASGIMNQLGLAELVARSDEEYVGRAVSLASDADSRRQFQLRIAAQRSALFADVTPVHALGEVLAATVNEGG